MWPLFVLCTFQSDGLPAHYERIKDLLIFMKTSDFLNPRHCIWAAISGTVQQMAPIRHASPGKLAMNTVVTRPIALTFSEKLLRSLRLNPVLALPALPPNLEYNASVTCGLSLPGCTRQMRLQASAWSKERQRGSKVRQIWF